MFTVCPNCTQQFRIYAEQIVIASGQVRCGLCNAKFNALEYLRDRVLSQEDLKRKIQQPLEPQFEILDDTKPKTTEFEAFELAKILIGNNDKRPTASSPFWNTISVFLVLVLVSQLLWFNRDAVLQKYPHMTPYVRQLCVTLNCNTIRKRDASAIKMLNRYVREHPSHPDALFVDLMLINGLSVRQPYPSIQMIVFDTNGVVIGHQIFSPNQYLDNEIEIDQGMVAEKPVHIVLEVGLPVAGAVGFEFHFL